MPAPDSASAPRLSRVPGWKKANFCRSVANFLLVASSCCRLASSLEVKPVIVAVSSFEVVVASLLH